MSLNVRRPEYSYNTNARGILRDCIWKFKELRILTWTITRFDDTAVIGHREQANAAHRIGGAITRLIFHLNHAKMANIVWICQSRTYRRQYPSSSCSAAEPTIFSYYASDSYVFIIASLLCYQSSSFRKHSECKFVMERIDTTHCITEYISCGICNCSSTLCIGVSCDFRVAQSNTKLDDEQLCSYKCRTFKNG